MEGKWLSVLEYAAYKKKSISTVRRYIKANRIKFKDENGKYYIWAKNYKNHQSDQEILEIKFENERLRKENRFLKEELDEMKMLISIYENDKRKNETPQLPDLPREI